MNKVRQKYHSEFSESGSSTGGGSKTDRKKRAIHNELF